jgi:hypothetical protein
MDRTVKITFGEMRQAGVTGILVYCADYQCSHMVRVDASQWAEEIRLSDIEGRFVCRAWRSRSEAF